MIAVIERHVNCRLGAGKEQSLLFGILANDVQLTAGALFGRQAVDDTCPCLAAVVRAIDVELLGTHRSRLTTKADVSEHVGRIDITVSGFNSCEAHTSRKIGEVRDVVSCLAAVERVVDLSVGASRPHDALLNCRDREI